MEHCRFQDEEEEKEMMYEDYNFPYTVDFPSVIVYTLYS